MKRYCQTLTLVDDEDMIEKYVEAHAHVWPEVTAGQHEVCFLSMQVYRHRRSLFVIMATEDNIDLDRSCHSGPTSGMEAYSTQFQSCSATASSAEV